MVATQKSRSSGFSLVEIMVAAAIIATVGLAVTLVWRQFIRMTQTGASLTQAALLTEEAAEALLTFRDDSWDGLIAPLPLDTVHYIYWDGLVYATSTSLVAANASYVVSFTLSSVDRDVNGDITSSGGTLDLDTVISTISVAPLGSPSSPISQSQLLIHDVYSN